MLRVFLVFLSLRLSFSLPAALACPSLCSLIAWCAPWSTRGNSALRFGCRQVPSPQSAWTAHRACLQLIDADLYDGTAGWGGEVLFRFAPLVFFSPYSILLGVVHSHCVQLHKRGVGTLCAVFRGRIGPSTKPRTMPARATSGMSARRQKTRGQLHGNGKLFAPPSAFAFERRARRVSSNRAVVVRWRRWKDTAAKETNVGQKRNL